MHLRLDEADDEVLKALAKSYGVSKQQAVIRAVREAAVRRDRSTMVQRVSAEVAQDWSELLERLRTS